MLVVKSLPVNEGDIREADSLPGLERSLEESTAITPAFSPGDSPWTEELGGL